MNPFSLLLTFRARVTRWWRARGLLARLLLPLMLVFIGGMLVDAQRDISHDTQELNEKNYRNGQEILTNLAPLVTDAIVLGDYSYLLQILQNSGTSRPAVEHLEWIPPSGNTITASTVLDTEQIAPYWFTRWTTLTGFDLTRKLTVGNKDYGTLGVRITPASAQDQLWLNFRDHLIHTVITLSLMIASIMIILHSNLKALRSLSKNVEQFTAGQHDVRATHEGAREIAAVSFAFNQMADRISSLVGDLSRHQNSLGSQLRFTRQLISMLPNPFYYTDPLGRTTGVNAAWEAFFGISQSDAFGKTSNELWEIQLGANNDAAIDATILQTGKAWIGEATLHAPGGHPRYVLIAKAPFHHPDGKIAGVIGTITDLTEAHTARARAQQANIEKLSAETANHAKSAFLANMSHEIRTPLTAIIGFSESLLDPEQSMEERFKAIQTVLGSGRHLLQLINAILDLSKIEAERLEIEHIEVDLFSLIQDIIQLMTLQMQEKGLSFHFTPHFPLPVKLRSDPVRIKQIIINLLSNAVKFTASGSIRMSIRWLPDAQSLEWCITDTGIGLSRDQQAKLFTPFEQADASTTRQYGGTGLGLYVSKRLAEMLGGSVTVESALGKGSKFTLTLNAQTVDAEQFIQQAPIMLPAANTQPFNMSQRLVGHVLLAEDNIHNQELIGMYLRKLGLKHTLADNGLRAVELATQQSYDLVLMDMQMPVLDGWEATTQLRARGYTQPIIALTANALRSDVERCLAAGCTGFLAKPIDRRIFSETLTQYLTREACASSTLPPLESVLLAEEPELEDLVEKFITELPILIDQTKQLCQAEDWGNMKRCLHDLKSVSGGYGYPLLSQIAGKLEFELLTDQRPNLDHLMTELKATSQRAQDGWRLRKNQHAMESASK